MSIQKCLANGIKFEVNSRSCRFRRHPLQPCADCKVTIQCTCLFPRACLTWAHSVPLFVRRSSLVKVATCFSSNSTQKLLYFLSVLGLWDEYERNGEATMLFRCCTTRHALFWKCGAKALVDFLMHKLKQAMSRWTENHCTCTRHTLAYHVIMGVVATPVKCGGLPMPP